MKQRFCYVLYCLLTQSIIILGWMRDKITCGAGVWMQRRYDRTFYACTSERWTCCDCGLEHITYPLHGEEPRDPAFRFVPVRIKDYRYKWRIGSGQSSPTKDESGLDVWTGKPRSNSVQEA